MKRKKYLGLCILIIFIISLFVPNIKIQAENNQELPEGIYRIKTGVGTDMYLDIDGGSKVDGGNLQIWKKDDVDQQKFKITKENGAYTIQAMHSGKVLDVAGGIAEQGTNVQQWSSNNTNAQQWEIKPIGNGKYNIISKCGGLALDIDDAGSANGTNVQAWGLNNTKAQQFEFENALEIQEGIYKIKTGVGTDMYLDIDGGSKVDGGNLQIWKKDNVDQQKFKLTYQNGAYTIQAMHSGKVLDVAGGVATQGTNVQQWSSNNTNAQQWEIKPIGNGKYNIISKCGGLSLDIDNAGSANGTNVQAWGLNNTKAQQFEFENTETQTSPKEEEKPPVEAPPKEEPPEEKLPVEPEKKLAQGTYKIRSRKDSTKVLDVDAGTGNIQIWTDADSKNQKFHVKDLGNGYYSIISVYSKQVLDVEGGKTVQGTNIQQWGPNGTIAQQWVIHNTEGDYYEIITRNSGQALDIQDGIMSDGRNVRTWETNHSEAQQFIFEKTEYQEIEDGTYEIQMNKDENKVLDISTGSRENGALVQLYSRANVPQQIFDIKYNKTNKTYTLTSVNSGKLLDIESKDAVPEAKIHQWAKDGETKSQQWIIEDLWDGTYKIKTALNENMYMSVLNGNTANEAKVRLNTENNTDEQKFKFIEKEYSASDFNNIDEAKYPGFKSAIQAIKNAHPNWNIKVLETNLDWNTVLSNEDTFSGGSPKSLSYDTYVGEWKASDITYDNGHWYQASRKAIAYMMDPRNSLDADGSWLFQFQDLTNSSGSRQEVQNMVQGTYLNNDSLINTIMSAAQTYNINPLHLVARMLQEQGRDGSGALNGHNDRGVYNLFNIKATGGSKDEVIANGVNHAVSMGWYTPEASIMGGAEFLSKDYISKGQSTLYFQKYNVVVDPLYSHQYMQNIRAANDEGNQIYYNYKEIGLLDAPYTFVIPLYLNMPQNKCPRPVP